MRSLASVRIGLVSVSDRASAGVYADQGIPSLKAWLARAVRNPIEFVERLVPDGGSDIRVLYGGSVRPRNAADLMAIADVDGGLIGGASLDVDDFMAIAGVYREDVKAAASA